MAIAPRIVIGARGVPGSSAPPASPPIQTRRPTPSGERDGDEDYDGNGGPKRGRVKTESWDCGGGLQDIRVDDAGCPVDRKYCKTQAGGNVLAVAAGAAWVITITLANFTEARVVGFILQAFSTAAGNADVLHTQEITGINIQGDEQLGNAVVGAERFRADATGAKVGTGENWRGRLGTTGGNLVINGLNRSLVAVDVIATVDVNAYRG